MQTRYDDFLGCGINGVAVRDPAYQEVSEMMGADYDDLDYLGKSRFRKFLRRIRNRIRKRRAARKRRGQKTTYAVQSPGGRLALTDEGLSFTRPSEAYPTTTTTPGTQPGILQKAGLGNINPMLLMIPVGVMAILAMQKKKK